MISPSSPDLLATKNARPSLSRSQTLPRMDAPPRRIRKNSIALEVDEDVLFKIRRWVHAIAIVDFDIDHGPMLDGAFPPLNLLPAEVENITFSSFPDSPQFEQGSQSHSFRIRDSQGAYINGFVYFTQRRNAALKRGYEQRSVVILTQHEYPTLFAAMSSVFGPLFAQHDVPMLETACHNIATWPDPTPGTILELGFLGSVLQVEIPQTIDHQQLTETSAFREKYNPQRHILAAASPLFPPVIHLFEAALSHLWSIWECVVLCEPILVFGPSPSQTSQAIWFLRDLLRPIPVAGDVRPYFTIHDRDHGSLVNKLPPKAGLLLGVTNPFFERECVHWPHTLSLGKKVAHKSSIRTPGPLPGWKTKTHKRYISKDQAILKQLEHALNGSGSDQLTASLAMRRHFCQRTNEMLIPLSRYLNTLIPPPADVRNGKTRLKPFQNSAFFASLKEHGSPLPFKSSTKRRDFYERWLKTPSFGLWLAQQEGIVQSVLRKSLDAP
ncbi:DUF1630-domain-containing protein [Cylindrobasidium torrendii FP15055 ss-10]|uniref:DUF1630-domain-containing protein n=1 Tax=Cylindrobasidium torrendii FP15055 ss-10 TaxID=1314674 RepID=A0A0D7BE10_9AGAR|nr:DUF1630-domain-containing protein [Cylindrobasidium torrendii FP15055 ss-10]